MDRYAQAVSVEFGVNGYLGVYHWYSQALYKAEEPCGDDRKPTACAGLNGAFSATIPADHELVHLAHLATTKYCPSVFEEGLAVYYSTQGKTASNADIELLTKRLDTPGEYLPWSEYDIAGRFVGLLVRRFGLDAVLEVCVIAGRRPDSETLASAMISVLGASPEELVAELAKNEEQCHHWERYESRVFACGEAGAARSAGVVDKDLLLRYRMGYNEETTVGPRDDDIWIIEQIEFLHTGGHFVAMFDTTDGSVPPVELTLAPCQPCELVWTYMPGDAVGPFWVYEPGTYWLEMRADKDFSAEFTLHFFN